MSPGSSPATPFVLPKVTRGAPVRSGRRAVGWESLLASTTSACAAITVGWALSQATKASLAVSLGQVTVYVALIGLSFGAVFCAWSDLAAGVYDRALIRAALGGGVGLITGAASGALAQTMFAGLQISGGDPNAARYYVLRAVAWAVFGAGIGVACGVAERAARKMVNGALGGGLGGGLGGACFQWLSLHVDSAGDARLLSFVVIGGAIGLAIGVVELARRQAWVRVLAGGMSGKEFNLQHAGTVIGSSPKCEIVLIKDPSAAPFHAKIEERNGRYVLSAMPGCEVLVNGGRARTHTLRSNDLIQIGSSVLDYQERQVA